MPSEVSIANRALTLLGADLIIALTDDNNRGRTMNANYEAIRDAELDRHRWRFSIARATLPALTAAPAFGFARQFQVPINFLKLIEGGDLTTGADLTDYRTGSSALWSREGDKILTSLNAPLHIRYIARITDPSLYSASFAEAFAARLADECCERITQSDSKRQICMAAYKRAISEAIRSNALEVPAESPADGEWVTCRAQ